LALLTMQLGLLIGIPAGLIAASLLAQPRLDSTGWFVPISKSEL